MANKARRLLIHVGKMLPFFLCFIVAISYAETSFALATSDFLLYDGQLIVNTPISFAMGVKFEYDILVVVITLIISVAIETCKWNLWATFYLLFNLMEKSYFNVEFEIWQIYLIAITNLIVCLFFVYKGLIIFFKKNG